MSDAVFDYDLFVIGAGSGGVRAARMTAATGARVGIAEQSDLGGTCVNVGCVPKKLFVYASHYAEDFHDAKGFGWQSETPHFNWQTLVENKNNEITRLNGIYGSLLENAGVELHNGRATIVDSHTVSVNGESLSAEKILIACGGKPFVPDFAGSEFVISSNDAFYLPELPRRILIVGGGFIAVEFAGIFNGLGVDVTQFYRKELFLRGFDVEVREKLATEMKVKGINLQFNTDIESIVKERTSDEGVSYKVTTTTGDTIETDLVMYATGRIPVTQELGLNNTKTQLNEKGQIIVNERFQTHEPSIFALGDVTGGMELTPVATAEAMAFINQNFGDDTFTMDYDFIASTVFSQPNLGTVGLTEEQAREKHVDDIDVFTSDFRHLKHTLSGNEERTFMKLIVQRSTDKVVGVHMLGADAGEIMQGIAIALKAGATKAIFDSTIGIHPTAAEEFVTMRTKR